MKVSDKWKEMVTASERVIEDFNDFADDRATVWADNQIKQLTAERDRLRAALENCKPVMESHAGTTRLALFNVALKEQL